MATQPPQPTTTSTAQVSLPRITITYCTQCKWLLRAAWLQQELLSTFGTSIGEIALIPSTGGIFQIHCTYIPVLVSGEQERTNEGASEVLIWDRKAEGGFPEAKVLKQRVRDVVEPGRGLGHSDSASKRKGGEGVGGDGTGDDGGDGKGKEGEGGGGEKCEDC